MADEAALDQSTEEASVLLLYHKFRARQVPSQLFTAASELWYLTVFLRRCWEYAKGAERMAAPVCKSFLALMQILDFTEGVEGEEAAVAEAEAAAEEVPETHALESS